MTEFRETTMLEKTLAEISLPHSSPTERSAARSFFAPVVVSIAASGLVALCAHVSVPLLFTPVPLSLAPWAVLLLGLVLGPRLAFASLCLYLVEGAAGLPVFSSQGAVGIAHLLGPTGGYLLSYPFAAALAGYLSPRGSRTFARGLIAAGAASVVILIAGATWLKLLTGMHLGLVLEQAVIPFLPGDMLKVCAAAGAATLVARFRNSHPAEGPL
jgi:biotin transport system substrate-specific component